MVQFLYTSTQVMAQAQAPGLDELLPTTVMIGQANETVIPLNDVSDDYGPLILDVGQHVKISRQNAGLGTTLILIGLVQVFFGFKFIRLTLFLTGFISWGKTKSKTGRQQHSNQTGKISCTPLIHGQE